MIIIRFNIVIVMLKMFWPSEKRNSITWNIRANSKNHGYEWPMSNESSFPRSSQKSVNAWHFTCINFKFQLQQFDCELQPLKEVLVEYPITFPPSYPYEEDPALPQDYMLTRCPAWCDRILMSPAAKNLINDNNFSSLHYNTIGNNVCMGDHKVNYYSCFFTIQFFHFHYWIC